MTLTLALTRLGRMYMTHREAHGVNLRMFWASHQRFFRALLMAFKVPDVAVEVRRYSLPLRCTRLHGRRGKPTRVHLLSGFLLRANTGV